MEKHKFERSMLPGYSEEKDIDDKNRQIIQNKEGKIEFTSAFIDLNGGCNLKCEGCFKHMDTEHPKERLNLEQIKEVIDFAKERGVKSIVFAGLGEPLMDKDFWNALDYIKENNLQSITFTNATLIKDKNTAKNLLEAGPVIAKRNTVNDNLQDKLVGVKGASKLMRYGLDNLLAAKKELEKKGQKSVIGMDSYVIKDNAEDLADLLRYCRKNDILPYFEAFIELGQLDKTVQKLALAQKELTDLFLKLQRIDKEDFGVDTPVVSGQRVYGQPICEKGSHMFSVRVDGKVYPCVSSIGEPLGILYDDEGTKKSLEKIFEPGNENLKKMFCSACSKRVRIELCRESTNKEIPGINSRNEYWDKRFEKGPIYTKEPSEVVKLLPPYLKDSREIIVVGGGYGRNAAFLAEQGFSVTNTDISSNALNIGKEIYKNLPNLKFEKRDALKLDEQTGKFDTIVAIYVLSLFTKEELDTILKGVKNIAKPKGKFFCNFLAKDDDEYAEGKKINKDIALHDDDKQLINFYDLDQIKSIFKKHNIKIDEVIKTEESRFIDVLKKKITSRSWLVLSSIKDL